KGARPDPKSPYYVGNLAMFGHGVRDEHQHGTFKPATFSFNIDRAVEAALQRPDSAGAPLGVLFVPRGAEPATTAGAARTGARIRIGSAAISVRRQQRQ